VKNQPKRKYILIVLIILTLCFIWGNSIMPAEISGAISERIKDIINFLLDGIGRGEALSGDGVLRKIAHASEFGLLGIELILLHRNAMKEKLTTIALYGLTVAVIDETLQLFSDGRAGLVKDVWIDFGGFTLGVLLILLIAFSLGILKR
jgi:VanZ family protein